MNNRTILSKDFILVALGQIVSIFGNQILRYALPLYLLNQTGSAALFGTVLAFSFIPMLLLYPIGGIVADRVNKRNIMLILDISTAILISLFYLMMGKIDIVPLMTITMIILYGIQGAYQPAVKASVPILVEAKQIMRANSIVDVINSSSSMLGPVIGGILFSVFGLMPILFASIACFAASASIDVFIHIPFEKRPASGNIVITGWKDLKTSFLFLFRERPVLWKISLIFASSNLLLTTLVLIGFPVIITRHLGFAPDTANRLYGYSQGVIAAGAVFGGLLAGILSKKLKAKAGPFLLIGCALPILMSGISLQVLNAPMGIYIVLSVGGGLLLTLHTLFQIQMMSYLQLLTPKELIGKVVSVFICVAMCTTPLGQVIYGFVFEKIGSNAAKAALYLPFYAASLLMIGISVFTFHIFCGIDSLMEQEKSPALFFPKTSMR